MDNTRNILESAYEGNIPPRPKKEMSDLERAEKNAYANYFYWLRKLEAVEGEPKEAQRIAAKCMAVWKTWQDARHERMKHEQMERLISMLEGASRD